MKKEMHYILRGLIIAAWLIVFYYAFIFFIIIGIIPILEYFDFPKKISDNIAFILSKTDNIQILLLIFFGGLHWFGKSPQIILSITKYKFPIVATLLIIPITIIVSYVIINDDPCMDDYVCKEGTELEYCPPCGKPCVVTKEYCDNFGGHWNVDTCKLDFSDFRKENCEKAGGIWSEGPSKFSVGKCDLTENCENYNYQIK